MTEHIRPSVLHISTHGGGPVPSFRSLLSQTEGLSQKVHTGARHFMCLPAALRRACPSHYQRMRDTIPLWLTGWRRMKTRRIFSASGRGGAEMRSGGGVVVTAFTEVSVVMLISGSWGGRIAEQKVLKSCHQVWDDGKIMRVVAWRPGVRDLIHVRFSSPSLTATRL